MTAANDMKKLEILEKILASNDSIRRVVARAQKFTASTVDDQARERRAANFIIAHYANLCGITGGLSGLPAYLPFIGAIYAIFGASASDALAALKFEIEMSLALSALVGFDIDDPKERKTAILLACASLEDEFDAEKQATFLDLVDSAISEYQTRQLSKTMAKLVAQAFVKIAARRSTRLFPLAGIAVGGGMNLALSIHTGRNCYEAICRRKRHLAEKHTTYSPNLDPDLEN